MRHIVPAEWRTGRPEADGEYLTITRWDHRKTAVTFTVEGGWNTHREMNGQVYTASALEDKDILMWLDVEYPEVLP